MAQIMTQPAYILGTRIDRLSLESAVERVAAMAIRADRSRLVVTSNPEIIMQARTDTELETILRHAALSVADGIGVVWAARMLGCPVPERVPGIELMERLLQRAPSLELRVFFLGTRPETIERAAGQSVSNHPGLQLVGVHHGYFDDNEAPAVVQKIRDAHPHLLFVGMGVPREQKFLWRHLQEFGPVTAIGVGGSFDIISGDKRRAPQWVQTARLEWLYRLVSEPRRFRRQATRLPSFVLAVLRERLRQSSH